MLDCCRSEIQKITRHLITLIRLSLLENILNNLKPCALGWNSTLLSESLHHFLLIRHCSVSFVLSIANSPSVLRCCHLFIATSNDMLNWCLVLKLFEPFGLLRFWKLFNWEFYLSFGDLLIWCDYNGRINLKHLLLFLSFKKIWIQLLSALRQPYNPCLELLNLQQFFNVRNARTAIEKINLHKKLCNSVLNHPLVFESLCVLWRYYPHNWVDFF